MTKLSELHKAVQTFDAQVTMPMRAAKGGATWKLVQGVGNKIPAALKSPIASIELMNQSKDPKDKEKIPGYLKVLHTQFDAIKLTPVDKYISEHSLGGHKVRGFFSTPGAKRDEEKRVELANKLKHQHERIQKMLKLMKGPNDL